MITREEIEKMPAGAELNKEVGVALGFAPSEQWHILDSTDGGSFIRFDSKYYANVWLEWMKKDHPLSQAAQTGEVTPIRLWPWASNGIEGAWKVVEAMAHKGYFLRLHTPFEPNKPHFAAFDFHGHADSRPPWEASGETAYLAICRSALLALLENQPGTALPSSKEASQPR